MGEQICENSENNFFKTEYITLFENIQESIEIEKQQIYKKVYINNWQPTYDGNLNSYPYQNIYNSGINFKIGKTEIHLTGESDYELVSSTDIDIDPIKQICVTIKKEGAFKFENVFFEKNKIIPKIVLKFSKGNFFYFFTIDDQYLFIRKKRK